LAATAVLSLALIGTAGAAAAQTSSPVDVVRAFIAAGNQGDRATLATLADPTFGLVEDAHQSGTHTESLAELEGHLAHVIVISLQQTGADTATLDADLTGRSLPPIRVPFHVSYAVTVANGRVVRMVETVAPETLAALEALGGSPGMPATGNGRDDGALAVLGLAVAAVTTLLAGTALRGRAVRR